MAEHRETTMLARHATNSPLGRVTLAGFIRNSTGVPGKGLRVLGSYALVYVIDGGGHYEDANGLKRSVRAGDLLTIFPELAHTYGPDPTTHWTELYLVFEGAMFDLWRTSGLLNPARPILHLEPIEHWAHRFESVLGAPRTPGAAPPLLEICRLQLALGEALLADSTGIRAGEDADWVERACALLEADIEREADLPDLAHDLGMSYDGFRKRFQHAIGVPPARYRTARAIDRACELMQLGTLTDRQIANRLGFCDEFYFSRRFKQVTGRTPRDFRASLPRG